MFDQYQLKLTCVTFRYFNFIALHFLITFEWNLTTLISICIEHKNQPDYEALCGGKGEMWLWTWIECRDSTEIMETQMQSEMLCNFRILELQFSWSAIQMPLIRSSYLYDADFHAEMKTSFVSQGSRSNYGFTTETNEARLKNYREIA
jgi:hypothetical protein